MSEVMTNQAAMYDSVEAIRNLNSVEGFNPRDFMRVIQGEGESAKYYLDVAFRKLWFRLKYPEGRISKRLLKLENDMAVIEARVYLNYRDAEENFVANAFSHKFRADHDGIVSLIERLHRHTVATAFLGALTDDDIHLLPVSVCQLEWFFPLFVDQLLKCRRNIRLPGDCELQLLPLCFL